jgi:glyoxylase-like metal-dependent hydrolase (beta-lactamase superfamily II)
MVKLRIKTTRRSHFDQNSRIIFNETDGLCIIIDPGYDAMAIMKESMLDKYKLSGIVLTHCHLDHAGAVASLIHMIASDYGITAPLLYHIDERPIARAIEMIASQYGLSGMYHNAPDASTWVSHGDTISFGQLSWDIYVTPGHSPGHICLYSTPEEVVFTGDYAIPTCSDLPILIAGDTLFKGSIGRTDLPMGNHAQLLTSIRNVHLQLPDSTIVLPGHGPNTTIRIEKRDNPFLI